MQENERCDREDWELAEAAGRGDEEAFAALTDRYQNAMHRFIFRSVGQEETARDLTQEVFVRAWFALPKATRMAKFTTWLFQIAVNICRDHARSLSTRQERITFSLVKGAPDETAEERQLADPGMGPDQALEHTELARLLEKEIHRLPSELLQPFVMGAMEGYPYKEIAVMLGLSPKAVEVRLYRARKLLQERLGDSRLDHLI
jgi:RNA polymerase sigma-70 factor (ECF subfamily)